MGHYRSQDPQVRHLLDRIELAADSSDQRIAIEALGSLAGSEAGRALIESFPLFPWRTTRLQLLQTLGKATDFRVVEFLMRVAADDTDLPMAAEAVVSLGDTQQPPAFETLLGMLDADNHPLQKEVIIALSQNPIFPCDAALLGLLERAENLAPSITQYLILALGRRRCLPAWPLIKTFLDPSRADTLGSCFDAALIAAGMLGSRDDIDFLRSLELRFQLFAHQLVQIAIMQIELRSGSRVDDLATLMLAADTRQSKVEYLITMRDQGYERVHRAMHDIQSKPDTESRLLLHALFPDRSRLEECFILIAEGLGSSVDTAAIVLKNALLLDPDGGWRRACKQLPKDILIALLQRTVVIGCEIWLTDAALDSSAGIRLRIDAVNALVAQVLMRINPERRRAVGRLLARVIAKSDNASLRYRAIRALGQIRHDGASELSTLAHLLREDPDARPSIYCALGLMGSESAARIAMKRLRVVLGRSGNDHEVRACIKSIGEYGTAVEPDLLPRMNAREREAAGVWLLRVLSQQRIAGFKSSIMAALNSPIFHTRLLGVVAAGVSADSELVARLFDLLSDRHEALAGRALYGICVGGTPRQHVRLVQHAIAEAWDDQRLHTLFGSLNVNADERYAPLITLLDDWLAQSPQAISADTRSMGANFCDNLRILLSRAPRRAGDDVGRLAPAATRHEIDRDLAHALPSFGVMSETIRSVLRNAELTYRNPRLFDSSVDKSTVIVEFVKSIDLFLQEKLGPWLFTRGSAQLFVRLQSRIVQLRLDDETITTARRIRELQVQTSYSIEDFPSHKLLSVCRAIMSGKLLNDQYRTIDGPRAWAVLIVAFGRDLSFHGQELPAILPVGRTNSGQMAEISAVLNRLQEMRNEAAHRGTLLKQADVSEIRLQSLAVLGQLTAIFGA